METNNNHTYQCAIIGGGLSGLCLAIQLAKLNYSVVLFEKNKYPFHKVCGEYISKESWNFIESLGLSLSEMNLPSINQLGISSTKGFMLNAPLTLGGFGISRFTLDYKLSVIAKECGVQIYEDCKVNDVKEKEDSSIIYTSKGIFNATIVCGSYGKYNPTFIDKTKENYSLNYIGVKYHIKTKFNDSKIELHNFKDGYCGISKVDNGNYCMCYLTTAKNLLQHNNDIKRLEENILMQNPYLKIYLTQAEFLFDKPLVISNVSFHKKTTYSNGIFLLGDAAGAIAPLCGNGMSIGMRASKLLALILHNYFTEKISKSEAISLYMQQWNNNFSTRIKTGYYLQQLLGKNAVTHVSLKFLNSTPTLLQKLISLTHGNPF